MDKTFIPADSPVGADVSAGRIFALAAHGCGGNVHAFDHVNTRQKRLRGKFGTVLILLMGHDTGYLARAAAYTFACISKDEAVHQKLLQ
jgi:hypothetical protein